MAYTYATLTTSTGNPGNIEFNVPVLAGWSDGNSGMIVSRKDPRIGWFLVDHTGKGGPYRIVGIQLDAGPPGSLGRLVYGMTLNSPWNDMEGIATHSESGTWYLDIWDNGVDDMYVTLEPDIDLSAAVPQTSFNRALHKTIRPTGLSGNCEAVAWNEANDEMVFIQPRGTGSASFRNDNQKDWHVVTAWSTRANNATPAASRFDGPVCRPSGTGIQNAIGDMDISRDGDAFVAAGVAGAGSTANTYMMVWGKKHDQTWPQRFAEKPQVTVAESFGTTIAVSEHCAFAGNMTKIYQGSEASAGNNSRTVSKQLTYTASTDDAPPPDPETGLSGDNSFVLGLSALGIGDYLNAGATSQTTVVAATFTATAAVPDVTVTQGASVSPSTINGTATVPQPLTPEPTTKAEPATLTATAAVPLPTLETPTTGATVTPNPVTATVTIDMPAVPTDTTVTVTPVTATAAVPAAAASSDSVVIIAREVGYLYRITIDGIERLVLGRGAPRSGLRGFHTREGWEAVSDAFRFNGRTEDTIMGLVAAAWATYSESDTDTLTSAVHDALNTAGYRAPNGDMLPT